MQTVLAVAKVEFLLLLRDRRFIGAGIALCVMLGCMLAASQARFLAEQRELAAAQQTAREQWKTRKGGGHALAHYGTYVYRKATPLSVLHPGAEPYVGVAAHIVAHQQTNMFYRPMLDRASLDRWADVSAATVLQVVVPLLMLMLAFASIAGDREDGRLRLFMSQGTTPISFAVGKLGGVLAVAVVLLLPMAAVVTFLVAQSALTLGSTEGLVVRLLTLLAGYGAVYFCFLAIGVAVSALASTRQNALLVCVGLWAMFCLVTPRVLGTYAEIWYPSPEQDVMEESITEERKDRKANRELRERVRKETLLRYKVTREEDLPVRLDAIMLQAGEEWVNSIHDRHLGKLWAQFDAQERSVALLGAMLTPAVPLRNLGETVSGTDAAALREHVRAVEAFRRDWVRRLNKADETRPRRRDRTISDSGDKPSVWATFPEFQHRPATMAVLAPRVLPGLAILYGWAVLSVLAAIFCVRYRIGANHVLS